MTRFAGVDQVSGRLEISEIDSLESIDAFEWDELLRQSPDATVFQRREWLQTFARVFRSSGSEIRILTARQGTRLVGLAPLMRAQAGDRTRDGDWLILGDDYSDYQTFLSWQGSARVVDALLDAIERMLPHGESMALHDVPQFSVLGLCLVDRASRDNRLIPGNVTACPTLRIRCNAAGVDRVLAKPGPERSERSLRRTGDVVFETSQNAAQILAYLPGLYAQHITRWEQTSSPSLFHSAANRRFYEGLTAALAPAGGIHYSLLRLDGVVVAQHYGLLSGESLLWYKPAFDVTQKKHSPGEVLLRRLVQHARDTGRHEVDFTRGDERFKSRFASLVRFNRHFHWHRRRGAHVMARVRRMGRFLRARVHREAPADMSSLGGVSDSARRSLVMLLNASPGTVAAWSSVRRQGVDVRAADVADLAMIQHARGSVLMVACDQSAANDLDSLRGDHPAREAALLPQRGCQDEDQAQDSHCQTEAGREPAAGLLSCVCAQGSLIQYFVSMPGASDCDALFVSCMVRLAQRELSRRCWHGGATVRFARGSSGDLVVEEVMPVLSAVEAAVESGVDLPLVLWRVASGMRVDAQSPANAWIRS
ncbi:GNAT family N-acetyltransferase [Povalibacter sp.]|uniref:GNAT family N-acetyltransferase n=1 Tax=Povalibacter sp. TaxID=1962978 RepID=UPI002F3E8933